MSDDLSEDEIQRMAEKLLAGYQPASALTGLDPEELRMAQRLLGRSNAERLATTGRDERFKYRRPVHVIEYYRGGWGWAIDLLENGKRQTFKAQLSDDELRTVLDAIRKKGVPIRHFETEGEKQDRLERARRLADRERQLEENPTPKDPPLRSARFDILNQLKDFRA
ncbi:hypothetical protein [Mesorhizobium sp. M4B.F.Ca.ET.017.02.2.1]|uniref:hypothetical protein n=1 Tax=Mesorhizobium sp. M4B.F.Ca.ET.017.02.2.1 TaxID=2496649 RepID=UPI000FCC5371|nr:hypothetical protein [Mesorhizobium sp. M4B.F.Ca.ET.017.02.2.1]RVD31436.1 hypothetical protein EN738_01915 [Mesorhizobium sp. M4B.F.Ca.ET.017.02.2.1]